MKKISHDEVPLDCYLKTKEIVKGKKLYLIMYKHKNNATILNTGKGYTYFTNGYTVRNFSFVFSNCDLFLLDKNEVLPYLI